MTHKKDNEGQNNFYNISDFFNQSEDGNKLKEPTEQKTNKDGNKKVEDNDNIDIKDNENGTSSNSKKPFNKRILLFIPIVIIFVGLIFTMFSKDEPANIPQFTTNNPSQPSDIGTTTKPVNKFEVSINKVELGEFEETIYAGTKDQFDLFFSNEEVTKKYGFFTGDQQTELIIIPLETQYMLNLTKAEITSNKEVNIYYDFGTPKIPRVTGHIKLFDANAYSIDFRNEESGLYKVNMINSDGTVMYHEEFDFTKPFYRSKWDVTSLTWGDKGELVFAGNQDGKWDIWSIDMDKQLKADSLKVQSEGFEPKKIVSDHSDIPLHTLTSLGVDNFNIPKPSLNKRLGLLIYHADMDIQGVRGDGGNTRTINVGSEYAISDGMIYFDYLPKSSSSGKYIYFLRQYDPQTNELWRMLFDGSHYEKFYIPANGYIKDFELSEDEKTVSVIVSNQKGDLLSGGDKLMVIPMQSPPKEPDLSKVMPYQQKEVSDKYNEELEAYKSLEKELTTVGYSLQDLDMSVNSKKIAFSMKEHQETSLIRRDIWTINVNNTELKRLTPNDEYMDINPVFSPNGDHIAFLSSKDGKAFKLWTMDSEGAGRMEMDRKIQVNSEPLWSEDGKFIYVSDIVGNIYEFNFETGEVLKILNGY